MRVPVLRRFALGLGWLACLFVATSAWAAGAARVKDVRLWSGPEGTRLVIETTAPVEYDVFALDGPHRIVVDLANTDLAGKTLPTGQGPVKQVRSGPQAGRGLRFVLDLDSVQQPRSFTVAADGTAGHRLVVELPGRTPVAVAEPAKTARASTAPAPTAPTGNEVLAMVATTSAAAAAAAAPPKVNDASSSPMTAVKSVKSAANGRDLVIAIDAGHGGQDPGAIGRNGTREKDVTLAIARKLAAAINAEEGMRAVLTRDGDYFITLGGRTRKARQLNADMFISIHADSVLKREVSGSSVYVLSLR
ncbi:MAG TPA: N-acetylmuramoyl-L-alanine amidase, partial [Steroidobacteraceae bacterium]|nr:N-acetylmuramoyl-L-alanine amidase [Steroidobacteraceae bacterium]